MKAFLVALGSLLSLSASAAVQYYSITGTTSANENACPAWVPEGNKDDCSYDASDPSGLGTDQWIGPIFSAAYYAPGTAPLTFTNSAPPSPVISPSAELTLTGRIGIPIAQGFIRIDDNGTSGPGDGGDDEIGGTIEFGAFERNLKTGPTTRVIEKFDRIIHWIEPRTVSGAAPNGSGGIDYIIGASEADGPVFPPVILGGSPADNFPSAVASQSSPDPADTPFWSGPGTNGIATFEGSGLVGTITQASAWGYLCNDGGASGAGSCDQSTGIYADGDLRASVNNLLLRISTDGAGNIIAAEAFLVYESSLSADIPGSDTWQATTLSFTGAVTSTALAFDDRAYLITGLEPNPSIDVDVLANDLPGAVPVTVEVTSRSPGAGGDVSVTVENKIGLSFNTQSPPDEEQDIFYQLTDGTNVLTSAKLNVIVTDPVTCSDDSVNGPPGEVITLDVLENDAGYDVSPISVTIKTPPAEGTVVVNGDRTITFTPPAGNGGLYPIGYVVSDGSLSSAECTATVRIEADPVAVDDVLFAAADATTSLDVLANDTGVTDAPLTLVVSEPPDRGTTTIDASGARPVIRYTPEAGYRGADSLQYRVTDADGESSTASVSIDVNVGQTPVAEDDESDVNFGQPTAIGVLENDSGTADGPIVIEITQQPSRGTARVENDFDPPFIVYTYEDASGYPATDTIRYRLTDKDGDVSGEATVTITPENEVVAVNDPDNFFTERLDFITTVNRPITVDVLANDGGLLRTPFTVTVINVVNGTAVANPDNTVTFTPAPGFTGVAAAGFQYRLTDADGDSDVGDVTIQVLPGAVTDDGGSALDPVLLGLLLSAGALARRRRHR